MIADSYFQQQKDLENVTSPVQVGGGLVERDDAAVGAERLCEGEADDEGGEHLLAGRAAAAHVHLSLVLHHHHLQKITNLETFSTNQLE